MATLTYVTAPDCHLCSYGRPIVADLGASLDALVREYDWYSDEGRSLIERDGVPFPPALYLDDRLLGFGRLSERRLRKLTKAVPV